MRKNRIFIFTLLFWLAGQLTALAGWVPDGEKTTLDFWLRNTPEVERVILNRQEVRLLNEKIKEVSSPLNSVDLAAYPESISGETLKKQLDKTSYRFVGDLYYNDKPLKESFKRELISRGNLKGIPDKVRTRYAVMVRYANLRSIPFSEAINNHAEGYTWELDRLQEMAVSTGEPAIVLHESRDGDFYYVQCYDYCGWVEADALAFTDREKWLQYIEPQSFLTVIKSHYTARLKEEEAFYQQGARLPLLEEEADCYIAAVPRRNKNGCLRETKVKISKQEAALCKGYLPYTAGNILRSAFADYGVPYGWGSMDKGVDCSGFIQNVYHTVGVRLPRNGGAQEKAFGRTTYFADGLDEKERFRLMQDISTGAEICFAGHVLLYLGSLEGKMYVIHAPFEVEENVPGRVVVASMSESEGRNSLKKIQTVKEYVLYK